MNSAERKQLKAEALRRYRARKREQIDDLKRVPCADCGGTFHPFVMDFDHREGESKQFNISAAVPLGLSLEAVRAEAAKCDIVCANCHRLRTLRRMEQDRMATPAPSEPCQRDRTHCPQGHPYSGENTRVRCNRFGVQRRECIQCVRAADRERGRRKRAGGVARA
jgi:hypothetical protein